MGLLPAAREAGPRRHLPAAHLARLQLIGRLQERGYSLAGIRDLLTSWRDGADLGEVLGLAPDQLVHLDEPGAPATLDQLARLLPALVPDRLDDLLAIGRRRRAADPTATASPAPRCCSSPSTPSPPATRPTRSLALLHDASATPPTLVADATTPCSPTRPPTLDADRLVALATRGRGLLAHGTGRLTIYTIGRRLGIDDETTSRRAPPAPRGRDR